MIQVPARELVDLADSTRADDPRALLARVELYALQGRPPSIGLRADIAAYLTGEWPFERSPREEELLARIASLEAQVGWHASGH